MEATGDIWLPLTILLTVAMASHLLMTRLKLHSVVGELLVGVFLAALALPVLSDFDLINVFAQLGAIILLFLVGLECDLKETYTMKSFWIAVGGVVVPFAGGISISMFLFNLDFVHSIIIASILVATSVAIPARMLMDYGKMNTPVARAVIGAAVVDDIIAMTLLAVIVSIGHGGFSVLGISFTVAKALIFLAAGTFVGNYVVKRIITYLDKRGRERGLKHTGFLIAFATAFLYAWIAEVIGLSAIIGAFVAGASLSSCDLGSDIMEGGEFLSALFTPIFFISLGLLVTFEGGLLESLILGFGFAFVVLIAKTAGAGGMARLFGMKPNNALLVGFSMSPIGEVALIIALYGLSNGLIDNVLYTSTIFMVIILSLIVPFILKPLILRGRLPTQKLTQIYQGCDACLGPIWTGHPVILCECGARFHENCAEKIGICPECGKELL